MLVTIACHMILTASKTANMKTKTIHYFLWKYDFTFLKTKFFYFPPLGSDGWPLENTRYCKRYVKCM